MAEHTDRLTGHGHPVGHVADHAHHDDAVVHALARRMWHQAGQGQDHDNDQHGRQRREQAERPPGVEGPQVYCTRSGLLGQQKRGDEVARQAEEEGDSGAPTAIGEAGHARVGAQHDENRDTAEAVELGTVLHRLPGFWERVGLRGPSGVLAAPMYRRPDGGAALLIAGRLAFHPRRPTSPPGGGGSAHDDRLSGVRCEGA